MLVDCWHCQSVTPHSISTSSCVPDAQNAHTIDTDCRPSARGWIVVRFQMFSRYINTDEDIPICTCIVYCLVVRLYPFFSFLMLFDYFWCVPSFSLGWKIGGEPFLSSYFFFILLIHFFSILSSLSAWANIFSQHLGFLFCVFFFTLPLTNINVVVAHQAHLIWTLRSHGTEPPVSGDIGGEKEATMNSCSSAQFWPFPVFMIIKYLRFNYLRLWS